MRQNELEVACEAARKTARTAGKRCAPFLRLAARWVAVEDIEQEAALACVARWHSYDPARAPPAAFGHVVGWSRSRSVLRAISAAGRVMRDAEGRIVADEKATAFAVDARPSPEDEAVSAQIAEKVRAAVDSVLSPACRAYAQEVFQGAEPQDAAENLGQRRGYGKTLAKKVREQMRARAPELAACL